MNSRNPLACATLTSNGLAATFGAVGRAPTSRGLLVCAALLSTGCGDDSDAQAANSTTASSTTDGPQTTAAATVASTSGATLTGSTDSSATGGGNGATGTTASTGGMSTGTSASSGASTTSGTSSGGADMGGTTGAGGTSSGSSTGGAGGGASGSGGGTTGGVSDDATLVPDPGWACGMAEGIPSPTQGELAFTITLDIRAEHEVGNTPYGYRRLLDVSGGTITGDRLQGSVLTGGLEYELELSNGVMEYQGINILDTGDGSRIFVRSCGVAPDAGSTPRIIPDFEATTSGSYAFLNTGTWVATREVKDGKMTLDVYDVSNVAAGEPRVEIAKPDGVPPQPWECNMTTGSQGAEVFTENVTLGGSFSIPNAKYGSRNVIPITGGTISGRVTGSILNGGADYQLSGSLDAWYTLAPDNGELILVRNCGAGGLIPWFEAAVDGDFDFLNTQAYLSSAPGVGAGGVSITFYERN